jgi:hypothetical protein
MGIIPGMGVTRNEFLDAYEYDGKYYENYDDIPFATKRAYDTGAKLVGDTVKTITDKPGIGHLLKGAAWVAGKGFQYIDKEAGGAYSTLLGLADQGMTKAADAVEYHTGLYSPTAKLGGELAIDYALSGGIGKTAKTAKVLASKADNLVTKAAKTLFPTPQLAFEAIPTEGLLSWGSRNAADASFNPSMIYASTATRLVHSQRVTDPDILYDKTKWNETLTDYSEKRNVKTTNIAGESVEQARTATHHMKGLADSSNPITKHPKGNQILSEARAEGLVLGEHPGNYIAAMDTITQGSRKFKVKTIKDLYPGIPEKSIKDALRQSIFDKSKWNLNAKELKALEEWQAFKLNAPPGSIVDTPKNVKAILNKTGDFPTIELINPNGSKTKWTPKTFEEYFNRWDKIGEHYGVKIDSKKIKGIKIDPNIDIYGKDHQHIHDMLKKLPSNIELENLISSGQWQKLSVADAKKIYVNAMQDQYKVAVNMSEYRYNKISEYFTKFDPKSRDFTKLPVKEQVKYFQDNIEKLSSRGSFKELPDMEYLTKDVNITPGMKAIFGLK